MRHCASFRSQLLLLVCASSLLLSSSLVFVSAQTSPTVNVNTVPEQLWSMSAFPQYSTYSYSPVTPSSVYFLRNNSFSVLDAITGQVTLVALINDSPLGFCYPPVVGPVTRNVFIACQPNIIISINVTAKSIQRNTVPSLFVLPATGNQIPVWSQPPFVTGAKGTDYVVLAGSGAMFVVDHRTEQVYPQYGPAVSNVMKGAWIYQMTVGVRTDNSSTLVVGAVGNKTNSGVIPSVLFQVELPAALDWPAPTNLFAFGDATVPEVKINSITVSPSKRVYASLQYVASDKTTKNGFIRYDTDSDAPAYNYKYSDDSIFHGFQESEDGKYLYPTQIVQNELPILDATDGTRTNLIPLPPANFTGLSGSRVVAAGGNVFLLNGGGLYSFPWSLTDPIPRFVWSFAYAQDGNFSTFFHPIMPFSQSVSRFDFITTPSGSILVGLGDYEFTTYSSVVALGCAFVNPHVSDNCGTCDGTTGTATARNCAQCSASSTCTEYYFAGMPAINQTCSDVPFPMSEDACNGAPSDRTVAIAIGCTVGAVILLSVLICYLAKRKVTQLRGDSYESV